MANFDGDIKLGVDLVPGNVESTAEKLRNKLKQIVSTASGSEKTSASFRNLFKEISRLYDKSNELQKKLSEVNKVKVPTAEYKALEKESTRLETKFEQILDKMDRFRYTGGSTNSRTFKGYEYDLESVERKLQEVNAEKEKMEKSGTAFKDSPKLTEYTDRLNDVNNDIMRCIARFAQLRRENNTDVKSLFLNTLEVSLRTLISLLPRTLNDVGNFTTKVRNAFGTLPNLFSQVTSGANSVAGGVKSVSDSMATMWKTTPTGTQYVASAFAKLGAGFKLFSANVQLAWSELNYKLFNLQGRISDIKYGFESFIDTLTNRFMRGVGTALAGAVRVSETTESVINRVYSSIGNFNFTNFVSNLRNFVANLQGSIASGADRLKQLFLSLPGIASQGLQGVKNIISSIPNMLAQGFSGIKNIGATIGGTLNRAMGFVITGAQRAAAGIQQLASSMMQALQSGFPGFLRMVGSGLLSVATAAANGAVALVRFIGPRIISGIGQVARLASVAAVNFAKMAGNAARAVGSGIINGFKRLASSLGKTSKASSNANGTFKKGFLFILRYAFGIRSIYFMFRRLRKALGDGLKNLVQYSGSFNATVSQFRSALTLLKNSFATAFKPLLDVVLPIITTFINAMAEAVSKIGMFIAALTGQKTFIKAKAVQEDYASSLDNTAGATNAANEAAKEYQKTISGFDDVEILQDPSKNGSGGGGSGGGGGGGGTSPQDMFETVQLPAGFYDLAQMIKDAWKDADFTDVGNLLGTKLAEALNNIPWETIKEKANKFGKSFATFINGLLSAEGLASAVGTTIGEGINTLFTFANGFISNLEWSNVGAFFAEVMNKGIATIQWTLVASTFANAANGILNAADTWAKKFNFAMLGTAIGNAVAYALNHIEWDTAKEAASSLGSGVATFINNAITPESLGSVGTALAEVINTVISGIQGFAITFNQTNLGLAIATGINNFFTKLDLEKAGVTFTTLSSKILTGLTTAVQNIEWYDIGVEIKDGIKAIDWGKLFSNAAELAGSVAGGIASLISGLFSGLGTAITDYFAEKKNQCGGNIVAGVFMGIADFFVSIGTWIKTNILDPFVSGFKSTFGIHSPADNPTIVELGKNIILGIVQGIIDWISGIKTWIKTNILDKFTSAWNDLGGLSGIIDTAISVVVSLAKKAGEWASEAWDVVKAGAQTITNAVTTVLDKAKTWVSDAWDVVKNGEQKLTNTVKTALDKASTWVSAAWDIVKNGEQNLTNTVKTALSKASTWVSDAWDAVKNGEQKFTNIVSTLVQKATGWVDDAWSAIKSGGSTVTTTVSTLVQKATGWVDDAWDAIKSGGQTLSTVVNALANLTDWNDAIPTDVAKRTIEGFTARLVGWIDSIKKKILGEDDGYTANVTDSEDNVPKSDRVLGKDGTGYVANIKEGNDNISDAEKKTGIGGWLAKFIHADQKEIPDSDKKVPVQANANHIDYEEVPKGDKLVPVTAKANKDLDQTGLTGNKVVGVTAKAGKDLDQKNLTKDVPVVGVTAKADKTLDTSELYKTGKNKKGKTTSTPTTTVGVNAKAGKKLDQSGLTSGKTVGVVAKANKDLNTNSMYTKNGNPKNSVDIEGKVSKITGLPEKKTIKVQVEYKGITDQQAKNMGLPGYKRGGGVFFNGMWHKIAQYATGGLPSHGTHFVAGERGAEVVGHIGGRTEVLNQSQLAAVMYSSIVAGMSPVISHITVCTNAIIATMGSALSYLNLMTLQIQELNTVTLPNIVTGKIVPSMSASSDVKEIKDTLSRMNSALDSYQNNVVTKDELADVLVTMFTRYMNLHFYVGDEDLARHVNRGNAKMDLRLNPVKG